MSFESLSDFINRLCAADKQIVSPNEGWTPLRVLTYHEEGLYEDVLCVRADLEALWGKAVSLLPHQRRLEIHSRADLTDEELEMLAHLMLVRDSLSELTRAFWFPLRYEFRAWTEINLEEGQLLGRRSNRRPLLVPEKVTEPAEWEREALIHMFGE